MGRLVVAALLGDRLRTASTIVAVQLAVALVCVLWAMPAELAAFLDELTSEARFSVTHRSGLSYGLPPRLARRIRALPGVHDAVASTYFGGSAERDGRVTFPSMAVEATHVANVYPDYGLPPEELGQFIRYRDGALVGRQTLRRHGWRIGHRIRLASALWGADLELEIVGALPGQPGLWLQEAHLEEALRERGGDGLPWNSIVWLRLDDLERRATVGEEPAATGSGARPVQGVEDAIEALGREVGVPLVLQSERSFYSRLLADLRGLATMLELVGALVAGCVTVVAASSISLGVRDRWRELATLRALGWSRSRIVAIVLGESSTIGVLGGIGGLLAARALVELARAIGGSDVAIGMLAAAQLDASTAAGVLACTAVVGSLVGILPAYGAVRRPSQALLREVPA
jgi:putative ABC transport system permease protein